MPIDTDQLHDRVTEYTTALTQLAAEEEAGFYVDPDAWASLDDEAHELVNLLSERLWVTPPTDRTD